MGSSQQTDQRRSISDGGQHHRLAVNTYDRVASLLVALLIMIGVVVLGLVIVYFARRLISTQVAIPVMPVDVASRPADAALGLKRDLEPPGIEDAPELTEPQLQQTLNAITSAVASRAAILSDESLDAEVEPGRGRELGDARMAGIGGEGEVIREPQRQIQFDPQSIEEYARWLDYFKIELGVLGRDNRVYYAYNFSQSPPDVRIGSPEEERRLYMNSMGSPLAALDRRLAATAGIAGRGRIILQFYPPDAQAVLYQLEQQAAGDRSVEDVERTIYRVRADGRQFEFSVEHQDYR